MRACSASKMRSIVSLRLSRATRRSRKCGLRHLYLGFTGKPKGVVVEHRQVARLFTATQDYFRFDQNDVWTLFHSFAFDFSVWEMLGALLYGGRLVVVPWWVSRSPRHSWSSASVRRSRYCTRRPRRSASLCPSRSSAGASVRCGS